MNEKSYIPNPEKMNKAMEQDITTRRAKKMEESIKKQNHRYETMTPEEKEEEKMRELDSFYKWGSEGHYRLWGNRKTIEESTHLSFGWGYDPEDEEQNYSVESWDLEDEEDKDGDNICGSTKRTKAELVEDWNNTKKKAGEEGR